MGNTRLLADCLVSSRLSTESSEERLRGNGGVANVCVSVYCRVLSRRPAGGEMAEDVMTVSTVVVACVCIDRSDAAWRDSNVDSSHCR